MTTTDLDERLANANPVAASALDQPAIVDAINTLGAQLRQLEPHAIVATADDYHGQQAIAAMASGPTHAGGDDVVAITRGRSVRRRRAAVAVAALAIAGTATAAAAAGGLFARTGEQSPGGEMGTGEVLRIDAHDAAAVMLELSAGIPAPDGFSFEEVIAARLPDEPTLEAESGVVFGLEFDAACAWLTQWLDATTAGDTSSAAEAADQIAGFTQRPGLTTSWDPADAGVKFWGAMAAEVAAGDPQGLRQAGYDGNCTDIVPGS